MAVGSFIFGPVTNRPYQAMVYVNAIQDWNLADKGQIVSFVLIWLRAAQVLQKKIKIKNLLIASQGCRRSEPII